MYEYECSVCSRVFGSASSLSQHANSGVHRLFRCNVCCDRSFQTAAALQQHTRDRRSQIDERLRDGRAMPRHHRHPCSDCGRLFGTAAALRQHRTDAPGHGHGESERHCAQCSRTFSSAQALLQHTRDSSSHRPITSHWSRCTICNATFSHPTEFLAHMSNARGHGAPNGMVGRRPDEGTSSSEAVQLEPEPELGLQGLLDDWNYGASEFYPNDIHPGMNYESQWEQRMAWIRSLAASSREDENVYDSEDEDEDEDGYGSEDEDFHGYEDELEVSAGSIQATPLTSGEDASSNAATLRHPDVPNITNSTGTADANNSPFGPLTLEDYLEAERARVIALEAELRSAKESLTETKCSMCYENSRDTVSKCGHRFCSGCVFSWQRQHPHPYHAPCPMCRKPMGKPIKMFAD